MKKLCTLSLFLIFTTLVFAQDSKLSLGVTGSADLYFIDLLPAALVEEGMNYSVGASAQYRFNSNLGLNFGLRYATRDFVVDYNFRFVDPGDPLLPKETSVGLSYLDIPVSINYLFYSKPPFDFFFTAGLVPGILLREEESLQFEDGRKVETQDFARNLNSFLLSGTLGVGVKYRLLDKLAVVLEPQYRIYFNSLGLVDEQRNPELFSVSLGTEIRF